MGSNSNETGESSTSCKGPSWLQARKSLFFPGKLNFPGEESFLKIEIAGFGHEIVLLNTDKSRDGSRGIEFGDRNLRDGGLCKILDMFEEGNIAIC
jgi:hypothetical protein